MAVGRAERVGGHRPVDDLPVDEAGAACPNYRRYTVRGVSSTRRPVADPKASVVETAARGVARKTSGVDTRGEGSGGEVGRD